MSDLSKIHGMLRKIERHFIPVRLNAIIEHPDVKPFVLLNGQNADTEALVRNRDNILLVGDEGAILFEQLQPGIFEAHTQILPNGRGEWAQLFVLSCLHWMFSRTTAIEIATRVPKGNVRALFGMKMLERTFGPLKEFTRQRAWVHNGEVVPADVYVLNLPTWMRHAPGLEERGEWFHKRLEEEYARVGKKEEIHEDDPLHDRYVGGCVEMIWGNQIVKGIVFYNRWATLCGYEPIKLLAENIIDIRDAKLFIRRKEQTFWVMQ